MSPGDGGGMVQKHMSRASRLVAIAAVSLFAVLVVADVAFRQHAILIPLLVVPPLLAASVCPPPVVALMGVLSVLAAVPLGAADGIFGTDRHVVYLGVLAVGGSVAVAMGRTRSRLIGLRETARIAHRRIALLDRSSRLIAAPMDFSARLQELARLVTPDVADLAVIDLTTEDGRLDGIIAN